MDDIDRSQWSVKDMMAERSVMEVIEAYRKGEVGRNHVETIVGKMVDLIALASQKPREPNEDADRTIHAATVIIHALMQRAGEERYTVTDEQFDALPDTAYIEIGINEGNFYAETRPVPDDEGMH